MTQLMILYLTEREQRLRIRNLLRRLGVRVVHDSGRRLMVVEAPDDPTALQQRLPEGARLAPAHTGAGALAKDLDESDMLFAKALELRMSKTYRDAKAAQVAGSSPEEKEIYSASCMAEE